MHVVLTLDGKDVTFDLTYDPQFAADFATRWCLEHRGCCEPEVANLMARVLRSGDFAIDVGANIGFFTILMARLVGPTGHVLAFEPGQNNLDKFQRNLTLNKLENVEHSGQPLWSRAEKVEFHLAADSGLNSMAANEHTLGRVPLHANVLDAFCRDRVPRLIKIDAEGSEEHILRGSIAILDRGVPFITAEINEPALERLGHSQRSLRDFMSDKGYSTFVLRSDGGLPIHVPYSTMIRTQDNTNVLFSDSMKVGMMWPEVTA